MCGYTRDVGVVDGSPHMCGRGWGFAMCLDCLGRVLSGAVLPFTSEISSLLISGVPCRLGSVECGGICCLGWGPDQQSLVKDSGGE